MTSAPAIAPGVNSDPSPPGVSTTREASTQGPPFQSALEEQYARTATAEGQSKSETPHSPGTPTDPAAERRRGRAHHQENADAGAQQTAAPLVATSASLVSSLPVPPAAGTPAASTETPEQSPSSPQASANDGPKPPGAPPAGGSTLGATLTAAQIPAAGAHATEAVPSSDTKTPSATEEAPTATSTTPVGSGPTTPTATPIPSSSATPAPVSPAPATTTQGAGVLPTQDAKPTGGSPTDGPRATPEPSPQEHQPTGERAASTPLPTAVTAAQTMDGARKPTSLSSSAAPLTSGARSLGAPAATPVSAVPDATLAAPAGAGQSVATATATATGSPQAPVPGYGVNLEQTIEAIHATIELATRQGLSQARIALHPAELGEISIHLSQSSQGLVARVTADTQAAAQTLADGHAELHQSLSALGVSLLRLDIGSSSQGSAQGTPGEQPGDGRPASSNSGNRRSTLQHELDGLEANPVEEPARASSTLAGATIDLLA